MPCHSGKFQAIMLLLGAFLAHTSPTSCPICISRASSVLLTRSVLPTLHFSTQPWPALADFVSGRGTKGWGPRDFGIGALQASRTLMGRRDPNLRGRKTLLQNGAHTSGKCRVLQSKRDIPYLPNSAATKGFHIREALMNVCSDELMKG